MSDWRVVVRDVNENRQAQLRHYNSATFIPRVNGIGTWQLEIPYSAPGAHFLVPGCGIVVSRNGEYVTSGPARTIRESWSRDRQEAVLTVSGLSDDYLLATHVVFPNPNSSILSQTTNSRRTGSGPAETMAKTILRENLLNTTAAVSDRIIQNFSIAPDQSRGSSIAVSLRFDNIMTWLQAALPAAGLGFQVTYTDADKFLFEVYVPRDLSQDIVFSRPNRRLEEYTAEQSAPEATVVFVGGAGTGITRTFTQGSVGSTPWGLRQEYFEDRRDTSDAGELATALSETLADKGTLPSSFSFEVSESEDVKFGRDYRLGDKVGYQIRGVSFGDIVTAVRYELGNGVERITPIIGDLESNQTRQAQITRDLYTRLNKIERRQ